MSETAEIEVQDYPNVRQRAEALGLTVPTALAFLPDNFDTAEDQAAFTQRPDATTMKKVMKAAGVSLDQLAPNLRPKYVVNRGADWIAPILFVSAGLASGDLTTVSVALNVASNYITDLLKGFPGSKTIKFEVVIEQKASSSCKRVTYVGDASGIPGLAEVIEKLSNE
jgi:hypothetical protein